MLLFILRQRYENIFICNPNTVFLNFLSVGSKSTLVGSKSTLVGSKSTLVGNKSTLVGNKSTLVGSKSTLVGNSPTLVGKSPQDVGKSPTPLIVYISIVGTIFFSWVSGQAIHCKLPPRARQGIGGRRPRRCRNNLLLRRTAVADKSEYLAVAINAVVAEHLSGGYLTRIGTLVYDVLYKIRITSHNRYMFNVLCFQYYSASTVRMIAW